LASLAPAGELAGTVQTMEPGVAGAVLLTTCNRVELVMDVADHVTGDRLLDVVRTGLAQLVPGADPRALAGLRVRSDDDAVQYFFEVAAGLRSAVIGDSQVAGQLRRAYEDACDRGGCTARLHRLCHDVLRASHAVASGTSLGAVGRSAAGAGLDLALGDAADLTGRRVLVVGTGSFSRVVVAELARRHADEICCWSASGRAEEFAAHHGVRAVPVDALVNALRGADLVVTCSGNGVVIDAATLLAARPHLAAAGDEGFAVIDLSLGGDVAQDAAALPGLRLARLQDIGSHASAQTSEVVAQARGVVAQHVAEHLANERTRRADPLVVALREHATALVDQEMSRVRGQESPEVVQVVERALRHVVGVMLHTPMVRVSQLTEQGRVDDCADALDVLFGLRVDA